MVRFMEQRDVYKRQDKMDDAVIYIKAMIKEIMASDIYIGESPVMVSNVTAPNNDMTKADNVTAESTDKVSDLRAGLNLSLIHI